jgi:hypothetical protein
MKTKMKTKLVVSICALTLIFAACKKDAVTPEPVLDCMGVENGIAAEDNCQVCHESYMYQGMGVMVTVATLADTAGLEGEFILAGSPEDIAFNPNWNNCDCNGVPNGIAALDTCGTCHESYMYQGMGVTTSVATLADTAGLDGMFILAGSPDDIMFNPYWNDCK